MVKRLRGPPMMLAAGLMAMTAILVLPIGSALAKNVNSGLIGTPAVVIAPGIVADMQTIAATTGGTLVQAKTSPSIIMARDGTITKKIRRTTAVTTLPVIAAGTQTVPETMMQGQDLAMALLTKSSGNEAAPWTQRYSPALGAGLDKTRLGLATMTMNAAKLAIDRFMKATLGTIAIG